MKYSNIILGWLLLSLLAVFAKRGETVFCSHPPPIDNSICAVGPEGRRNARGCLLSSRWIRYRVGDKVHYNCESGYQLRGDPEATCTRSGQWTRLPKCVRSGRCKDLPEIVNGYCRPKSHTNRRTPGQRRSYSVSTTITCSCWAGYKMQGSSSSQCRGSNRWAPLPRCVADSCGRPPKIANGRCGGSQRSYQRNEQTSCFCRPGYDRIGSSVVRCRGRNEWTMPPACQKHIQPSTTPEPEPVGCPKLPRIPYAQCRLANFNRQPQTWRKVRRGLLVEQVGTIYDCRCRSGYYQRSGTSTIECMFHGEWSPQPECRLLPTTTPNSVCGDPMEVINAVGFKINEDGKRMSRNFNFKSSSLLPRIRGGEQVQYRCKRRFEMQGTPVVSCTLQGRWTTFPTCVRQQQCLSTPRIRRGRCEKVTGDGDTYNRGDQAVCRCNRGHRMTGRPAITCRGPDQWTTLPICRRRSRPTTPLPTCNRPTIKNAQCSCDNDPDAVWHLHDTVRITCNRGFELIGDSAIVCQRDGKWSGLPNCRRVDIGCSPTPIISDGYCEKRNNYYGHKDRYDLNDKALCRCDNGYSLNGRAVVTCRGFDRWTILPTCSPDQNFSFPLVTCDYPPPINDATCNCPDPNRKYHLGDRIRFSCNPGFERVGNSVVTCRRTGRWSNLPSCVKSSRIGGCGLPRRLPGARWPPIKDNPSNLIDTDIGDRLRYTCKNGFHMQGTGIIACLSHGKWSRYPKCIPAG